MKLYIKLFFGTGIPYGIFMGIFFARSQNIEVAIISAIIAAALFGFFMSIILGTFHHIITKKIKSKSSNNKSPVHQIREINLNVPFEKAFNLCVESVAKIKKGKLLKQDKANGIIEAKAGITWKTFGDEIKFKLKKEGEQSTLVEVSSRPWVKTTLVDYGKNLENVNIIEGYLTK